MRLKQVKHEGYRIVRRFLHVGKQSNSVKVSEFQPSVPPRCRNDKDNAILYDLCSFIDADSRDCPGAGPVSASGPWPVRSPAPREFDLRSLGPSLWGPDCNSDWSWGGSGVPPSPSPMPQTKDR